MKCWQKWSVCSLEKMVGKKIQLQKLDATQWINVLYRPALRCFNCQRLGHVAAVSKGRRRCCKCGGDRDYGQYGEGIEPICCNCGGPHSAAFLGCKDQKLATEAMKYITVQNI